MAWGKLLRSKSDTKLDPHSIRIVCSLFGPRRTPAVRILMSDPPAFVASGRVDVLLGSGDDAGKLCIVPGDEFMARPMPRRGAGKNANIVVISTKAWPDVPCGKHAPVGMPVITDDRIVITLPDWSAAPARVEPAKPQAAAPAKVERPPVAMAPPPPTPPPAALQVDRLTWPQIKKTAAADGYELNELHDLGAYNKARQSRGKSLLALRG